ncbi:zinc-ribbon domain-containing protein [Priestia flexa]|nr:zinc-ribbon domain-containing protein [Priestia flexa]
MGAFCRECGKKLPENAVACPSCGTMVKEKEWLLTTLFV